MTHEIRYFIEYRICGKLRLELITLREILSKHFPEMEQYPFNEPHITLIPPINEKISEKLISQIIKEEFGKMSILEFKVDGYDFFNNEDEKVIFVKINFDKETTKIRHNILKRLKGLTDITNKYEGEGFNPHIALGYTQTAKEAKEIVKFLNKNHPLSLRQVLDRINLLNGSKILLAYDIFNKRVLSGRQASRHNSRLLNIRKIIEIKNGNR